jgi:beta-mannosidase
MHIVDKIAILALGLTLLAGACEPANAQSPVSPEQIVSLNSGWEFRQRTNDDKVPAVWRPAGVPGMVHTDLLNNGLIPDPYYADNESKLQWIENADWEYRRSLQIGRELLNRNHLDLVFQGLDTCADLYINGQLVLSADNMFLEWRVDIKPHLREGANDLLIVFHSPIKAAAQVAAQDTWSHRTTVAEKAYLRKAAYMYGWDWGPRFVSSGIWKPVQLEAWDNLRISDFSIRQLNVNPEVANLTAKVEIQAAKSGPATVTVRCDSTQTCTGLTRNIILQSGTNQIDIPIDVIHPALWYPAGYGKQPVYHFTASVMESNKITAVRSTRTGLRSVVLRRDPDQWGRSFEFVVNGIPVFAKGANVIPFDNFPARVQAETIRQFLQSTRDTNMNMVRIWGGGYYETEEFYDICDDLGIMVWQDFMLADIRTPGTYSYKENIAREAEYQIKRLRNHPSIVLWCGNNETESTWRGWRNSFKTSLPVEVSAKMWEDYLTVSSGILARIVAQLSSGTPYWPSSPSADGEDTSDAWQSGDMHDWSVWSGRAPISDYEKHYPRFMSEFGFQSFPDMRTIQAFTSPEDRAGIMTPVLRAHQKYDQGNTVLQDYVLRYYRQPKDLAAFSYVSQLLQAEAIKTDVEHLRRSRPRSMGALFWQLNDCWPGISWSSIDYYGRWKALQYYARRFYSDLLVSPHVEDGAVAVYVVSDRTEAVTAELSVKLITMDGTVLTQSTQKLQVPPLSSAVYMKTSMEELLLARHADPARTILAAYLTVDGHEVSNNLLYFAAPKDLQLIPPIITSAVTQDGKGYRLHLSPKYLAVGVYISFGDLDAKLSDNYFDLLPGVPYEVKVDSAATAARLKDGLRIVSLADATAENTVH